MDWCVDEGHVPLNICLTIGKDRRPKPAQARSRFLTADQVAGLWKAAGGLSVAVHRDYVRLLLVVPCRRTEAAKMDWGHINLDEAAWSQPGQLTKNNEAHRLHLPELVLNILRARWEAAGKPASGLVFPSPKAGAALTTHSAIKAELDKLAGFSAWSWHDMRRTFATTLGEAGVSESVVDAVLNHKQSATRSGVLGVYQMAQRRPEQIQVMEAWGAILEAAIDGREHPGETVVRLVRRRA
jgi:integrase